MARSLYYYRTGEVLDYTLLRRLKNITHNSTMATGSAAQELIAELRFVIYTYVISSTPYMYVCLIITLSTIGRTHLLILLQFTMQRISNLRLLVCYNGQAQTNAFRKSHCQKCQPFLDIHSTRSSMCIEGKMLLGQPYFLHFLIALLIVYYLKLFFCIILALPISCCVGPPRRSAPISKIS